MVFTKIAPVVVSYFPKLKQQMLVARLKKTAEKYVAEVLFNSVMITIVFSLLLFMFFSSTNTGLFYLIPAAPLIFIGSMLFFLNIPFVYIARREREINKNVLFAGRYLLVKIQSGEPLFGSLIGVAKSYGATGEVFNEIVQDIHFGAKIEDAIDKAIKNNPCDNLKKILWEISNSIKTGSDMARSLGAILDGINEEYFTEIEKYGRKINSITLFYMVLAIIVPSLGITMASIIASFIGIKIPMSILYFVIFIIAFVQFMFISLYKSIRPAVLV